MALIKTIQKPNSGTPLSYWRPVYFTVYSDRIEILVDGFFSVQQREAGASPDWQGIAISPLPDIIPGGRLADVKYAVLKGASMNGVSFSDAEDFNEDPWRTPAEAVE